MRSVHLGPVLGTSGLVAVLAGVQAVDGMPAIGWLVGLLASVAVNGLLAVGLRRSGAVRMGAANWVTLTRATLGQAVAALVVVSLVEGSVAAALVPISVLALLLDAVDGQVARRTGTVTALGARFDMEADAFLILVLSIAVAPVVGWWVLLIGLARYLSWLAGRVWPWLRAPVPPRYWRKVVAAIQGVVLTAAVAGALPGMLADVMLVGALGLLAESFGRDVVRLSHGHRAEQGLASLAAALERAALEPPALGSGALEPAGR